jgi:hypothetical protein
VIMRVLTMFLCRYSSQGDSPNRLTTLKLSRPRNTVFDGEYIGVRGQRPLPRAFSILDLGDLLRHLPYLNTLHCYDLFLSHHARPLRGGADTVFRRMDLTEVLAPLAETLKDLTLTITNNSAVNLTGDGRSFRNFLALRKLHVHWDLLRPSGLPNRLLEAQTKFNLYKTIPPNLQSLQVCRLHLGYRTKCHTLNSAPHRLHRPD